MEIIPAIDIIDGKCVRLSKGDYSSKKVYHESPLIVAQEMEQAGLQRLHLVDLDGAKKGTVINWTVLETIAKKTSLKIDFSGGLSAKEDIARCFDAGATYASIGSVAVKKVEMMQEWIQVFGADKFIISADVRNEKVAIKGWMEQTELSITDLINQYLPSGITQFICTDINKDGLLQGPSIALYTTLREQFPSLKFIASGGISTIADIVHLKKIGCSGAIIGKAFYEGHITLKQLANQMKINS